MQNAKKLLLSAALVAAVGAVTVNSMPAHARVAVNVVYATKAPPPPRTERVPPPRRGYVWVPGEWRWANGRYVWHQGSWARARHGYRYTAPRWEQEGNRWRYYDGRWDH
ncbi:MAG: hypothetical protein LBQ20_10930 [Rhodanobacter sp.]|jgi:hypothetical protein|nr:hypothetical protein [Rhodanobacter sp.]